MAGLSGILYLDCKSQNDAKLELNMMLDKISSRGLCKKRILEVTGYNNGYIGIISNYDIKNIGDKYKIFLDGKIYNLDYLLDKYFINTDKKSLNDTQKIELLFEKFSVDIFKELEGPFALIIIDKDGNFFISRDYLGRKPLYYSLDRQQNRILFASEIKAIDPFLKKGELFILKPGTFIKNSDKPKYFKKFNPNYIKNSELTDKAEVIEKIDNLLTNAIKKRFLPYKNKILGVWLSGGLDSSLIAAILKKHQDNVITFSVGFENSPDLLASRIVAGHIGSKHVEHILKIDEIFNMIPEAVYTLESFDAPLLRSSIGNMIVSKLSSEADIVFSGEGGDEVFAGYNYYLDLDSNEKIRQELLKALESLHNTALQRVDRFANKYSIDVKLPLLDEKLIDFSLKIHPELKVKNNITKYILRKTALKYLPENIVWRPKDKFWEGSGINEKLKNRIDKIISDDEFNKNLKITNSFKIRNKEELFYFQIFKKLFPNSNYKNILSFTADFN
ncbi:MAG: asparagine synthase-related protein [Candidatus Humimicrobiaceae bacterium]